MRLLEQDKNGWKTSYIIAINSHYAIGWMMTLYPLMSARRKGQIKQVLSEWRNAKAHNGFTITTGAALISMIARKHGISHRDARLRYRRGEFVTGSDGRTYIGSLKKIGHKFPENLDYLITHSRNTKRKVIHARNRCRECRGRHGIRASFT